IASGFDEKARKVFGDQPLYVAFRQDAVFVALGEDGLAAMKEAVTAAAKAGPALRFDIALGRLMLASANDAQSKAAQKLLEQGEQARIRVSLEGGEVLRVRLSMDFAVLQLVAQTARSTESKQAK